MASKKQDGRVHLTCSLSPEEWEFVRPRLPFGLSESKFLKQLVFKSLNINTDETQDEFDMEGDDD